MGRRRAWSAGALIAGMLLLIGVFAATVVLWSQGLAAGIAPLPYLTVAAMDLLPFAAVGSALLLLAATLARSHRAAIGLALIVPVASTAAGMTWDVVVESAGWSWGATLVAAYWLGLVLVTAAGASLSRTLLLTQRAER